jgi:hypothetical protein
MHITVTTELDVLEQGINQSLSNSLWNILIENTPKETGNLALNTIRINSSPKLSRFMMNTVEAPYGEFLDSGIGRNKKHTGYFSEKTPIDMAWEISGYALMGSLLKTTVPSITLRMGKVRNYERQMIAKTGFNMNKRITAHERATMGILYNQMKNDARHIGKRSLSSSLKGTRPNMQYNTLFSTQERFEINDKGTGVGIK